MWLGSRKPACMHRGADPNDTSIGELQKLAAWKSAHADQTTEDSRSTSTRKGEIQADQGQKKPSWSYSVTSLAPKRRLLMPIKSVLAKLARG